MDLQFQIYGKAVRVSFNETFLSCDGFEKESIKTDHIIAVTMKIYNESVNTLEVQYVDQKYDRTLKICVMRLSGSEENCSTLKDAIQKYIQGTRRPKRLLVFINPKGGRKKGKRVFSKIAEPIFKLCNIEIDLKCTTKSEYPREVLQSYDLSSIDGVIAVGGDGLYCECLNGLIIAQQAENGTDVNDPESTLSKCQLPIGLIPAGSGNVTAKYLHGTRDVTTAVLRIVLGNLVQTNAASIHEGGLLKSYSGLVLGFGLFGDMMHDCEKFRWMGPYRYEVVPLKTMLTKRDVVDVEVEYQPADDTIKVDRRQLFGRQLSCPAKKLQENKTLRQRIMSTPDLDIQINEWKKTDGRVHAVDTHPIAMKAESGKMIPHFGDDALTLILTDECSLAKHVTQLKMVKDEKPECYDFDFVRKIRVKGYRVKLPKTPVTKDVSGAYCLEEDYYINCDGNIIKLVQPEFEVRMHSKIVQLFGSVAD